MFFDNKLAKRIHDILFIKVENDGYDLGAQRRKIDGSDLPMAFDIIKAFQTGGWKKVDKTKHDNKKILLVSKKKINDNEDFILSGEKYRDTENYKKQKWPMVSLNELFKTITPPKKMKSSDFKSAGKYPIIDQSQNEISGWTNDINAIVDIKKPVVIFGDHTCAIKYFEKPFAQGADGIKILNTGERLLPKFLYFLLKYKPIKSDGYKRHFTKLKNLQIPVPPLEVQKEIISRIEKKQSVINDAEKLIAEVERERESKFWTNF